MEFVSCGQVLNAFGEKAPGLKRKEKKGVGENHLCVLCDLCGLSF
jgi:hypothetical protein